MNRRKFLASTGAAAVALNNGRTPAAPAPNPTRRVLPKLGDQTGPTNEKHLQYLARYGVRNICGWPTNGEGRLYATVDELKAMRDLAEKNGISIDCIGPPDFWRPSPH